MKGCCLIILLVFANNIFAKEICKVGNVDLGWYTHVSKFELNSSYRGVLEEFDIENVAKSYFDDSKYIAVTIEGAKLKISTTKAFEDYEKFESSLEIKAKWFVECDDGENTETFDLNYEQRILDENKYAPFFLKSDGYVYEFYGDLKEDFALSDALNIQAHDLDISTEALYFSMPDNPDFSIQWTDFEDKVGTAEFSTDKYLTAPNEYSYNITVTDVYWSEGKTTSTTVKVILHPNPDDSFGFASDKYSASIKNDQLTFVDEIKLKNGLDFDTKVKIRSDYEDYFSASVNMLKNTIEVKLTKPLPTTRSYTSIDLYVEATWMGLTASAKITVGSDKPIAKLCYIYGLDLNEKENENEDNIYDNHTGIIKTYDTLNVESVDCTGTGTKYITCTLKDNKLTLEVTEEFKKYEDNEFTSEILLDMSVGCPYETPHFEYRQWVEDINNHDPKFNQDRYDFVFYNRVPHNLKLSDVMPITVSDVDISTIYFSTVVDRSIFTEYLSISETDAHEKKATCRLSVTDIMEVGFERDFVLTVEDSGNPRRSSDSIVSIKIHKDEEQLKFNEPEADAIFQNNIIDSIQLVNGFDDDTKFNLRSEYGDFFKIVPNILKSQIEIRAIKDLSAIKLDVVRLIIEAEWHGLQDSVMVNVHMDGNLPTTVTTTAASTPATHPTTVEEGGSTATTTTTTSTTKPIIDSTEGSLDGFKKWAFTINIVQITLVSVAGIIFCALGYVALRYYY